MEIRYVTRISQRAKRLQIRVLPSGRVEVVVPRGCDPRRAARFVETRAAWIERALARLGRRPGDHVRVPEGIELPAIGLQRRVVHVRRCPPRLAETEMGTLRLEGSEEEALVLLREWLHGLGRDHLVPWLRRVGEELGLPFGKAVVRCQRTRWGSCSARGTISINRNLLFLEPELVRHLFVHELCHTRHLDHSPAYWATVARFAPDHRDMERRLRGALFRVPAWALPD